MEITRNKTALMDLANAIEQFPDYYYQGSWFTEGSYILEAEDEHFCGGGAACVAGWAVIRAGVLDQSRRFKEDFKIRPGLLASHSYYGDVIRRSDKAGYNAQWAGATILGLTWGEAQVLFSEYWRPATGFTVPQALRAFASGADLLDVTNWREMLRGDDDDVEFDYREEETIQAMLDDPRGIVARLKADLPLLHDPSHYDRDGNIRTAELQ